MDFAGFKKYKLKQTFLNDLASGIVTPKHFCIIEETGEVWSQGVYIPKLPKATQTSLGLVMGGTNISIGADGSINWTGQIKTISYWIANQNWGSGTVGENCAIYEELITKATGQSTVPSEGDIVITTDGYQYVVSGKDDMGRIFGIIVTVPPSTAVWSNISGALSNNQYLPALKTDGGSVSIIGVDSSNTVQVGSNSQKLNFRSTGKVTNNGLELLTSEDLNTVKTDLDQKITTVANDVAGITTDYDTKITNEQTARTQEDARLKSLIDTEVADRGAADLDLANKLAALIDDSNPSFNKVFSSQKVMNAIVQVYHTVPDVQTVADLPAESTLETPSICYVISEKTQYINSLSGSGWHSSGGDFITVNDLVKYLTDNGFIKSANLIDNVTTADSKKALSANMGKWLMDNKLSATTTVDNLTSEDTKNPLSANMGRYLNEQKLGKTDVINNLTSTVTDKPLSSHQGKILFDEIIKIRLWFTGSKAKNAILADTATAANKLSEVKRISVNLTGYVTGNGYIDTDLSANPTINIVTKGGEKTSTLQQNNAAWYHYNKLNTNACLLRFKSGQQHNLHIMFYDNFQGNYSFNWCVRPIPKPSQLGSYSRATGRCEMKSGYNFTVDSRICIYEKGGYIYVYMVKTAQYHICGFVVTLSTEGGGGIEMLPMGNGVAVDLPTDAEYTYLNNFSLYELTKAHNTFIVDNETQRAGYIAPTIGPVIY